jgi:hypothetical protein
MKVKVPQWGLFIPVSHDRFVRMTFIYSHAIRVAIRVLYRHLLRRGAARGAACHAAYLGLFRSWRGKIDNASIHATRLFPPRAQLGHRRGCLQVVKQFIVGILGRHRTSRVHLSAVFSVHLFRRSLRFLASTCFMPSGMRKSEN